jgi:hypothetical protein
MAQFSLRKTLIGFAVFTGIFQGCLDKETKKNSEGLKEIKTYTVDLFPKESMIYDNTGKLSFDEAFEISKEVLYVASIIKVDSSDSRGVKPFYIYQATEGRFEKSSDVKKNKLPILFLSEQKLFKGKTLNDSIYLFLEPLQQYELLRKNQEIKYKWLQNAPFVKY